MSMELFGTVVQVLPVVTGTSAKGTWSKQDFILETDGKYPKKVAITLWGQESIDKYDLVEGMKVTAFLELDSREYQGKWFTNVKAWKLQWDDQKRPEPTKAKAKEQEWPQSEHHVGPDSNKWPTDVKPDVNTDDLPF